MTESAAPEVGVAAATEEIALVCACDDHYAMPLAVALHSACRNLSPGYRIRLYFLDGGFSDASWTALRETLSGHPIEIEALRPDPAAFRDLKISHHITPAAYFRLHAAELVPSSVCKAIYLDSDVLVSGDLAELWGMPLGDNFCLAAVDIACPFIDARVGCRNFRKSSPYLSAIRPIPNYRRLGLDGAQHYFNSGVMVLNLQKWRSVNVGESLLRCLRENKRHAWCWDQYALNVVFEGSWKRIPPRWNQGGHVFEYPSSRHSPINEDEFVEMRDRPAIVHYTTKQKPWHYGSVHPLRDLFLAELELTAWRGWLPERGRATLRSWAQHGWDRLYRRLTISFRSVAAMWPQP